MNIKEIKFNQENPRNISDYMFKKLIQSIKDFPQMLELRPLVIDEDNVVLGGNMRLKALHKLGIDEIPVKKIEGLTQKQKREFIIKDNLSYGEWDWGVINEEWDLTELDDWGFTNNIDDIDSFDESDLDSEYKNNPFSITITSTDIKVHNEVYEHIKNTTTDFDIKIKVNGGEL